MIELIDEPREVTIGLAVFFGFMVLAIGGLVVSIAMKIFRRRK